MKTSRGMKITPVSYLEQAKESAEQLLNYFAHDYKVPASITVTMECEGVKFTGVLYPESTKHDGEVKK